MAGKSETLVSRLGLYDKLLECLVPGEDYVAYGVVEDRSARCSQTRPTFFSMRRGMFGEIQATGPPRRRCRGT